MIIVLPPKDRDRRRELHRFPPGKTPLEGKVC
jgi:hypothetical protein